MSANSTYNIGTKIAKFLWIAALLLCVTKCNLNAEFVKTMADAYKENKAGKRHWDRQMVEFALVNSIVTNEGYLEIVPDYEPLLLNTIFSYLAYANVWMSEKLDDAEAEGDFDEVEFLNLRMALMYARALELSKHALRLRDKGFNQALSNGDASFRKWVNFTFYKEEDAELLALTGSAWFATIENSEDGLAAAVDRPFAEMLLKRSVELDPEVEGALALTVLGTVECTVPVGVGGKPKRGLAYLERAAAITERKNHSILLTMAYRCAVGLQDRAMFKRLIKEILEAKDAEDFRIQNKFVRKKAQRLLREIDELFLEDIE